MSDVSDMELLRDYARQNSEAAFAELVRRHLNLVYSAALRHVGMVAQAEEIAQAVFVILTRKAGSLREGLILEAWLFETTRLTALSFSRGERRRKFREQEAYMQSTLQESTSDPGWEQLSPVLDEAMMRLGSKEREAIVLRFFKERSLGEVASALNIKEPAAQMRVIRALEKLRRFFAKRGVHSTTAIIAGAISSNSVQAAPSALAQSVTAAALVKGAAASTSTLTLVKGALKIMAWTKAKTATVATAVVILAAITGTIAVKSARNHSRAYALETRHFIHSQPIYSPQQIHIKAYFLEVPESDVPTVLAAGTAINTTNDNSAEIMDAGKMAAVLRLPGVTTLGDPSVVTIFGRQARVYVDNNYVVDLFPTLLADGYGIKMKMLGGSRNPFTAEANLWDGQTLALGGPPSDGQTRLFVFANVRQIDQAGNWIHSPADLQSRLGTIPPQ